MSPNCDDCASNSCRIYTCNRDEEFKSLDTNLLVFSENFSYTSTINNICVGNTPKMDGGSYKRRKLHGTSVALLSEENATRTKLRSFSHNVNIGCSKDTLAKGNLLISRQQCLRKPAAVYSDSDLKSSSKKHTINMKTEAKYNEELSDTIRQMCISVLRNLGQLGAQSTATHISELSFTCDKNLPCKICGFSEKMQKMLICDLCEEAFHVTCCNLKVKELPIDEWYCQPCFKTKPKPFLRTPERRSLSYSEMIPLMLQDSEANTTDKRIGKKFQAEVPVWSGPNSIENSYYGAPFETDPNDFIDLNGWASKKPNFIGNWIQCREVIDTDENGGGIICGKWRRAPLFLEQTEDWDCSCAITWDPIHADCAVPQELETCEVMQHLKFKQKVNARLATRKKKS